MKTDVAILIVTYNSTAQVHACLGSVLRERHHVQQEVIVLDNNSTDDTVAQVRAHYPDVKLLTPGRNLGFAAGVNAAARIARADFLLLLNPDTVIVDHAIDTVVDFARAHPMHGLYGGRTLRVDGSLEPSSCWGLPSLWSMALFATGISTLARHNRYLDPESLGSWPRDTIREVGVITGCFLLVSRTAWEELGGFDERFFMYGEDVDLAMRAHRAGYRPVICPDARLIHEVGQSSSTPLHKALLLYRGKATLVRTHWRGPGRILGLALLLTGVAVRALPSRLQSLVGSPRISTWHGLWRVRHQWIGGYGKRHPLDPASTGPTLLAKPVSTPTSP